MIKFTMKLAGVKIGANVTYETTRNMCRAYLCQQEPDFCVEVAEADIRFEREKSAKEDILEGKPVQEYSDAYLETLALYRKIVDKLVDYDVLLFHGSVVAVDGEGYLFTAKSGTGKSTHTGYWRELFGQRAVMVNDDKPLLRITGEGAIVYGTPWDGKHHLSTNISVPLKAICILERGDVNQIRKVTAKDVLPMLIQQSHSPRNKLKYLELMDKLTGNTAFYRLSCTNNPEAARVSYEAMSQN